MKKVDKWQSRLKIKKYSTIILIVTFLLSLTFVGLTVYGTKAGNFVINIVDADEIRLAVSEDKGFANPLSYLYAKGLSDMGDTTLSRLPSLATLDSQDGSHNDPTGYKEYIAYTFYIKNYSTTAVDLQATINIIDATQRVDSAVRVMLITDGYTDNAEIFAKAQESGAEAGQPEQNNGLYQCTSFESDTVVMKKLYPNMGMDSVIKFTVVIWLEGHDADCVDSIMGGRLKMSMNFIGY